MLSTLHAPARKNRCKGALSGKSGGWAVLLFTLVFTCAFSAHAFCQGLQPQSLNNPRAVSQGGDSAGGTVLIPSQTRCSAEDPGSMRGSCGSMNNHGAASRPSAGGSRATFGTDILVRDAGFTTYESNHSLACDPEGNFYMAFQDSEVMGRIQIYWSNDGGEHWQFYASLGYTGVGCQQPCIAVGAGTQSKLLVAYIVDNGVQMAYPEVAVADLHSSHFTIHSVPVWTGWDRYLSPVIWTDSALHSDWKAYLTCEGIVDTATGDCDICFWESDDLGNTWGNETILFGEKDSLAWRSPHGAFGTTKERLFLTCFNANDHTLYCRTTADHCGAWQAPVAIHTMSVMPLAWVLPEVAASMVHDHVLIAATWSDNGNDDICTALSTTAGDSWVFQNSIPGSTNEHEKAATLVAHEAGGNWHLAFTRDHDCCYSRAPQDLSTGFQAVPDQVSDLSTASAGTSKKGIACTLNTDTVGICWSDSRDGLPDLDTYFDHTVDPSRIYVPEDYFTIQDAIDNAVNGQSIHVYANTYHENLDYKGKAVTIRGTFGPELTVIDGNQDRVVRFNTGEGADSVIEGFTLTNGYAASTGGGIFCSETSPVIRGNIIRDNAAAAGAGIFICGPCSPLVEGNFIVENDTAAASGMGAGIRCLLSNALIRNNIIAGNTGSSGGGVACYESPIYFVNNTVIGNTGPDGYGAGFCVVGTSVPNIRNSIFRGNDGMGTVNDQIFCSSGLTKVANCNVEGGYSGVGCIDADPLFADPLAGDYHLTKWSPCINMGIDHNAPPLDMDGNARPHMGTTDMGAYEFIGTHSFSASGFEIQTKSATIIDLSLRADVNNTKRSYFILGSVSDRAPGLPLPGGMVTLPLNWDPITDLLIGMANSPSLVNFHSQLDHKGYGNAQINTLGPLPPSAVGAVLYFAYLLYYPFIFYPYDVVSNPVVIKVVL